MSNVYQVKLNMTGDLIATAPSKSVCSDETLDGLAKLSFHVAVRRCRCASGEQIIFQSRTLLIVAASSAHSLSSRTAAR